MKVFIIIAIKATHYFNGIRCEDVDTFPNREKCQHVPDDCEGVRIPETTEIFINITDTKMCEIPNHYFEEYPDIEYITVSNNLIFQIELDAFSGLRNLKRVDLSSNCIPRINNALFKSNPKLKILILKNNLLNIQLNDTFLVKAFSLEYLDLSYCALWFLPKDLLKSLHNLKSLDLRGNPLMVSNVRQLNVPWPNSINMEETSMTCDCQTDCCLLYSKTLSDYDESNTNTMAFNINSQPVQTSGLTFSHGLLIGIFIMTVVIVICIFLYMRWYLETHFRAEMQKCERAEMHPLLTPPTRVPE